MVLQLWFVPNRPREDRQANSGGLGKIAASKSETAWGKQ